MEPNTAQIWAFPVDHPSTLIDRPTLYKANRRPLKIQLRRSAVDDGVSVTLDVNMTEVRESATSFTGSSRHIGRLVRVRPRWRVAIPTCGPSRE